MINKYLSIFLCLGSLVLPVNGYADHPLINNWEGLYEWDCDGNTGSAEIVIEIDSVESSGYFSGITSYLGGSTTVTGWICQSVVEGELGFEGCMGFADPDGHYMITYIDPSDNNVYNEFYGVINDEYTLIEGTTLNGDHVFPWGLHGCSAAVGTAGTFAIVTEQITGPTELKDCKNGNWEQFGFKNQGRCIQFVNTGKDSR